MKFVKPVQIMLASALLVFAALACRVNAGGPKPPEENKIPVSEEAARSVEQIVPTVQESGDFSITLTEEQVTSYIALKMKSPSSNDLALTDPQVFLRDGTIQIYGTLEQNLFTARVKIVVRPSVDENGQLEIQIEEVDFGPIPVPASLADSIRQAVQDGIQQSQTGGQNFLFTAIDIADGRIIITGHYAN